jgi:hypothetical protein
MSNTNMKTKLFAGLSALLIGLGCTSVVFAQDPSLVNETHTSYTIGYYNVNPAADAQIHIINPGSTDGYKYPTGTGNLCANIYVFNAGQQMIACCSCQVSPNGMQGLSLKSNLLVNTLTPGDATTTSGAIEIVSSRGGGPPAGLLGSTPPYGPSISSNYSNQACDAGSWYPAGGDLETYITHVRSVASAGGQTSVGVTESDFPSAPLGEYEYQYLAQACSSIESPLVGSGFGQCLCPPGQAY